MFTSAEIIALVKKGFTPAQIVELSREDVTEAASTVAAPPSTGKTVPAWIVEHAQRKAARRSLASTMRAAGQDPSDPKAWKAAKRAAKIV